MLGDTGSAHRATTATSSALIVLDGTTGTVRGMQNEDDTQAQAARVLNGLIAMRRDPNTPLNNYGVGVSFQLRRGDMGTEPAATESGRISSIMTSVPSLNSDLIFSVLNGGTLTEAGRFLGGSSVTYIQAQRFVDAADNTYFIDPAATGTSIFIDGNIQSNGAFTINSNGNNDITLDAGTAEVNIGSTGTGKLDAGTIDPPYTINGTKYATFLPAMTGIKEETSDTVEVNEYIAGVGYRSIIDFRNQPEGSDLWLFGKTTNIKKNFYKLVVLLASQDNARSWYTVDPDRLTLSIYANRPTTVSYRLTAPRFDWERWKNTRDPLDTSSGFILNDPDEPLPLVLGQNGNVLGASTAPLSIRKSETGSQLPYQLVTLTNELLGTVDSFSEATIANLSAGLVNAKEVVAETISIGGQSLADYIRSIVSTEIGQISLSPIASDSAGLTVRLDEKQHFGIYNNKDSAPAAIFDAFGNATLAGTLTAKSLGSETATVSGTLYADRIVTKFGEINQLSSPLIQNITNITYATPSSILDTSDDATSSALLALLAQDVAAIKALPPIGLPQASDSSTFTIPSDFAVIGHTALGNTSIAGSLLTSGPLSLSSDGIQTIGDTLYLQKNKLAVVDILGGTLTITSVGDVFLTGNLALSGNLAIGGILGVNTMTPATGDHVDILLPYETGPPIESSGSGVRLTRFGKLAILGRNSQPVVTIDASGSATFAGDITASGSGTFRKLEITQGSRADVTATGAGILVPESTAGTATIAPGATSITIFNSLVTSSSLIYVTPTTTTNNQVLYVKEKIGRVSFTVGLDKPLTSPVTFNWWIIN